MVGTEGIAPSASCMSGRRSAAELRPLNWCSRLGSHQRPPPSDDGALLTELQERNGKILNYWSDGRIRAGDLLHAMQARWLLRYVSIQMAGVMGLAPTSSTVTGWTLVSSYSRPQTGSRSWSRTNTRRFKGG